MKYEGQVWQLTNSPDGDGDVKLKYADGRVMDKYVHVRALGRAAAEDSLDAWSRL